ncbi:ABC transporter ATP-binding protein [Schnuerera ultunensis]|uniref:Uncharacterized ABC transporter ATP-binding protein YufO n=1 Tax=[Clostridium] ultunense Esp TaxID=1288971 RepID=A0A1M4PLY9_9FIRM|nr:Uncharacterized ABC transporter ATP-binding protein YufO [[Clostridium] ultunense Esp]
MNFLTRKVLELKNIRKVYDNGVVANDGIDLTLNQSEIHAIVGENGAGKSTLMNIVFGEIKPTAGTILLRGEQVYFGSPKQAIEKGIGMVHQHFKLVDSLTVAHNIFLGIEPKKAGFIDKNKMIRLTSELAEKYKFRIDPEALVRDISVGEKQKVEILKVLARGAEILILDEPTAVLTPQETEELFTELRTFKETGYSIIFISHKLNEVKSISDKITVIRKGKTLGTYDGSELSESELSNLMVGREVVRSFDKVLVEKGEVVLDIHNLKLVNDFGKKKLNNFNLSLNRGVILGVAGVEGNGQDDLVKCICGLNKEYSGEILICNRDIKKLGISEIRDLGVAHIPEDRMTDGVALDAKISENLISTKLNNNDLKTFNLMSQVKINELSEKLVEDFAISCDSINSTVRMLSGGNMQKVVIAREFSSEPNLIVVNQPTRGVDVGSAESIYRRLLRMRDDGAAILMVSSDLNEILELSDSVIVMYEGEIAAYFESSKSLTEEELGYYMLGIKNQRNDGGISHGS